jgi:bifunctional non-homologous end joining protein LigD
VTRESTVSLTKEKVMKRTTHSRTAMGQYDAAKMELEGVRLTSPEKLLYPGPEITKLELANYFRSVAEWILPHIKNRPLVLVRCPDGQANGCFYQKHPGAGTPDALRQVFIREKSKTEPYVIVDNVAGLVSLAQIGALEIHAWGSLADKLDRPDRVIFDLDPAPHVAWKNVVASARQLRQFLLELGLESFVKTTGGKGLHLVVPIDRRHEWEEVKAFCKDVADLIVTADPDHYIANMSKAARQGKIFIDYLRNDRGATAVVPFSPRARPEAPVSTPVAWAELSARIPSDHYTIRNLTKRLARLARDPWEGFESVRQGLASARKKLRVMSRE